MGVKGGNGRPMVYHVGAIFKNKWGQSFKITDVCGVGKFEIVFEDGTKTHTYSASIKRGITRNPSTHSANGREIPAKIGDTFTNKEGQRCEVVGYLGAGEILIRFVDTGHKLTTKMDTLRSGGFRDPYHPFICGVGYMGTKYTSVDSKQYNMWTSMLRRCYGGSAAGKDASYEGCFVEEYLHGFENFYDFVTPMKGFSLGYQLDKDLLVRGNREYRRDRITFLPKIINVAIQGSKKGVKGGNLPAGVFYRKDTNKYRAISGEYGKLVHCGQYCDPMDAFYAYKKSKEAYLKKLAIEYKDTIELQAFDALMSYEVNPCD